MLQMTKPTTNASIYLSIYLFICIYKIHFCFQQSQGAITCLLYRADGDTCRTGHNEVTIFNVWSDLIQYERNDVWLHSQEENITLVHSLFITGGEMDSQSLYKSHNLVLEISIGIHYMSPTMLYTMN